MYDIELLAAIIGIIAILAGTVLFKGLPRIARKTVVVGIYALNHLNRLLKIGEKETEMTKSGYELAGAMLIGFGAIALAFSILSYAAFFLNPPT